HRHLSLHLLNECFHILRLMQRFVVALSLGFKILREVIVGITKTIRVLEVDLLRAHLVPQRLEQGYDNDCYIFGPFPLVVPFPQFITAY
ncbi:MAG TPA: hypothetical protein VIY29_26875, partial [Ktedonobacteraceae bacterium]